METTQKILLIITIIGAINWGLVGLLDLDLVALVFGVQTILTRIVYGIVAVCGIVNIGILMSHLEFQKD
ncbi:MAG: DUF378 domain-containing protein [Bacilli bacterium]|nr:DUF378 domain-containing protein [Bacilli bacterium]